MRKLCIIVTGLFCTLLFTTCKQYFADIENDLSYWSSEVTAGVVTCDQLSQTIGGAMCIPSATDAAFTLKVRNPKSFTLVTPSSPADAQNIINFPGLSPQPVYGTDYTLQQTSSDTLTLTYKSGFLQRHEWGAGNIGAEITFISTDGRVFGDRFNLNIRADSAPVLESAGIGKTATADSSGNHYYVLLFRVKEMDATAAAGTPPVAQLRHKDLNGGKLIVTKDRGNPVELPLTFNPGNTDFTPGAFPLTNMELLAQDAVTKLDSADPPFPLIPPQHWILCLKTDVIVGGPEKLYEVCIKDTQGLRSALIPARTKKNKLADVELLDGSTPITGTTAGNPKMFAGISGKTLTAQAAPAGAVITGTVWRFTSAPGNWTQTDTVSGTTTAAVTLPPLAAGENQARYKISLTAALSGYEDSNPTDFYITVKKVLTINGSEPLAWKALKEAVSAASDGGLIIINGEIKATNDPDNSGEILIDKDLTIKGSNETTDKLNANSNHATAPADAPATKHRIFKVEAGKTLTLKNLTIKGGKGEVGGDGGGGIYAAGTLTMTNCTVTDNETEYGNGGGIYAGATLTMEGCTVNSNTVSDNSGGSGGGIYIHVTGTHTMTDCTLTGNEVKYSHGGGIYAKGTLTMTNCTLTGNEAKSNGGGIYIDGTGSLTMTDCTLTGNKAKSNGNGGGIYIDGTGSLTMTGGAVSNNTTEYGDGGGIYIDGTGSLTMTDCTLTGNEATGNQTGGGVYVNGASFTMKGASRITPSPDNGKNDVYLANGKMITVDGALTGTAPVARITVAYTQYLSTTQVLTGGAVSSEHLKFSVTRGGTPPKNWYVGNNGNLTDDPVAIFNTITKEKIEALESAMIYTNHPTDPNKTKKITNRQANLPNKLILYKTSEGNYGIMLVTEVNNTSNPIPGVGQKGHIKINYKTFNSNSAIKQSDNDKEVPGTHKFNLDNGTETGDPDFWLENNSSTSDTRHFTPENGAKFYVLP